MIIEPLIKAYENSPKLPTVVETAICNLFGVNKVAELTSTQKTELRIQFRNIFNNKGQVNYKEYHTAYTLYYLPANFFKIWQPLIDLIKYQQVAKQLNVLEFGSGPGSCTLGLIEFYNSLAKANTAEQFQLNISTIEKESEFIDILQRIYDVYQPTLSPNLIVNLCQKQFDLNNPLQIDDKIKFDLLLESNMFNNNENISSVALDNFCRISRLNTSKHASVITIEPADERIKEAIIQLKNKLLAHGLSMYSPCNCSASCCNQFISAQVNLTNSTVITDLDKYKIRPMNKLYHYYSYFVFRSDGLTKFTNCGNGITKLSELQNYVSKEINFKAFVISCSNQTNCINLKICDGSLVQRTDIWFEIPDNLARSKVKIKCGEFVTVKNARVVKSNKIICELHTRIVVEG